MFSKKHHSRTPLLTKCSECDVGDRKREEGKGDGILIVNSWGKNWSGDGMQVLWEKGSRNCIAQEYVAIKSAKVI